MIDTRPDVVIVANVADMQECQEKAVYPRDEWDAMTPVERALEMADLGATAMSNAGGYGVSVESGADEETEVAVLPDIATLIRQVDNLTATLRDAGLTDEDIERIKNMGAS